MGGTIKCPAIDNVLIKIIIGVVTENSNRVVVTNNLELQESYNKFDRVTRA